MFDDSRDAGDKVLSDDQLSRQLHDSPWERAMRESGTHATADADFSRDESEWGSWLAEDLVSRAPSRAA